MNIKLKDYKMTGVGVHNIKFTKNKKMGRRKVCHN